MIHPCLTNTSSIYTLELVFSILADNLLGFQSATSAVYTVSMSRSADQSLVHESDLIEDRDYDTEDADPQSGTDEEVDTLSQCPVDGNKQYCFLATPEGEAGAAVGIVYAPHADKLMVRSLPSCL